MTRLWVWAVLHNWWLGERIAYRWFWLGRLYHRKRMIAGIIWREQYNAPHKRG